MSKFLNYFKYNDSQRCKLCKAPYQNSGGSAILLNKWCQSCEATKFQKDFPNWTSGNQDVDLLIQHTQLNAKNSENYLEWIPYENFTKIKEINKGGYSTIYEAKWKHSYRSLWNEDWNHTEDWVILKQLHHDDEISIQFLDQIQSIFGDGSIKRNEESFVMLTKYYGFSKNPITKEYIVIQQYMYNGNLREWFKKPYAKENLYSKINHSWIVSGSLKIIHEKNQYHGNLHPGNIVVQGVSTTTGILPKILVSDWGLSKPVNNIILKGEIFGVLPYVAPEILRGKAYTKLSDIYSFGMIMYELGTGKRPFYNLAHDENLVYEICVNDLRPEYNENELPKFYTNLMERCWSQDPSERPDADELFDIIENLGKDGNKDEYLNQIKEAEEYQRLVMLENNITSYDNMIHNDAIYTSRELSRYTILLPIEFMDINNNDTEINEKVHNDDDDNSHSHSNDNKGDNGYDYNSNNKYNYLYEFLYEKSQSYNLISGNNKLELNLENVWN